MRTVDVLIAARDFLSEESRWTTGRYFGQGLADTSNRAAASCACSIGALYMASDSDPGKESGPFMRAKAYLDEAAGVFDFRKRKSAIIVNDAAGYPTVLAMFDLAIKRAKRRHINGK